VLLDVKNGAPARFAGTGIIAITNASKRDIYPREFKNELNLRLGLHIQYMCSFNCISCTKNSGSSIAMCPSTM
jgi:hypothetical protein